jgi:bacterioferritin-associated ferredoxin
MYVCTCNGISERSVDAAIEGGAASPVAVHRACGVRPQCGRGLPEIVDRLRAARAAPSCQALTPAQEGVEVAIPA